MRKQNTASDRREPKGSGGLFHAVSLSGGKDSTALLLLMIERGMPIDAVIWADTGMEFPEMYGHIAKVDEYLFRERGLHITTLRSPKSFEYIMFDEPKQKPSCLENRARLGIPPYGNGWPGIKVRWCTGQLKTHPMNKALNRLKAQHQIQRYVGIAADEAWRCKGLNYPLVEWGVTEAQALQLCYDRGFDFGGLYEIYRRASCWCCPLADWGTAEPENTPPGVVVAVDGTGQPGQGTVWPRSPGAIQEKLERSTAGGTVCQGGVWDMKHLLRRLYVPP